MNYNVVIMDYTTASIDIYTYDHELSEEELNSLLDEKYHRRDIYYMCGENISINYERNNY